MEMEFTARQVKISKALRTQAEDGLHRVSQILGKTARASVTFSVQRHHQIAELTIQARTQTLVATGKADTHESALRQAIEHAEQQAVRYRDRKLDRKRLPREDKEHAALPVAPPKARAPRSRATAPPAAEEPTRRNHGRTRTAIAVHSYPTRTTIVEPHVLKSAEAVALKPMTIEEAVKEAEFRDRDILIFRNKAGDLFVLHRRRDGEMELVEVP